MPLVRRTLTIGNYAFSAVAIFATAIMLWAWLQAALAWGNPQPYADALMWTLFTAIAFGAVFAIEYAQNTGE